MKRLILISVMFCLLGLFNLKAQEQKAVKDTEVAFSVAMHCENCAAKVKKQLAYTKGVKDVIVSLEKQEVIVKYRSDKTDTGKLITSLSEIGYEAKIVEKNNIQK